MRLLPLILALWLVPAAAEPFIEVELEPAEPYVQQQVTYTLRLYRDSHLQQGDFLRPETPHVLLRHAGSSEPHRLVHQGREMEVLEERWLLFPQRSGLLELPAPVFSGRDFYLRGEPARLRVRPRPVGSGDFPWLVTDELGLTEEWNGSLEGVRGGDSRLREIRISARQVTGAQIPPLDLPPLPHFSLHRLPPRISDTFEAGELWGERVETFLYVANGEGRGMLPAIEIRWWNPEKERVVVKRLAPIGYSIEAGHSGISRQSSAAPVADEAEVKREGHPWFTWPVVLVIAMVLLWLVRRNLPESGRKSWGHFKLFLACMRNRPRPALEALQPLLGWRNLFQVEPATQDPKLQEAYCDLVKAVYGPPSQRPWQGRAAWKQLRKLSCVVAGKRIRDHREVLPPLWRHDRAG